MVRLSTRGLEAVKRGLQTLDVIAREMGVDVGLLEKAPKAEWHHDLSNLKKVWLYDRQSVFEYAIRSRVLKLPGYNARSLRNIRSMGFPADLNR